MTEVIIQTAVKFIGELVASLNKLTFEPRDMENKKYQIDTLRELFKEVEYNENLKMSDVIDRINTINMLIELSDIKISKFTLSTYGYDSVQKTLKINFDNTHVDFTFETIESYINGTNINRANPGTFVSGPVIYVWNDGCLKSYKEIVRHANYDLNLKTQREIDIVELEYKILTNKLNSIVVSNLYLAIAIIYFYYNNKLTYAVFISVLISFSIISTLLDLNSVKAFSTLLVLFIVLKDNFDMIIRPILIYFKIDYLFVLSSTIIPAAIPGIPVTP